MCEMVSRGEFQGCMQVLNGYVDRDGRLIGADPRLMALQIAAGGSEGGVLAVPQLISLARIARSLAIPISRPVVISDGDRTVQILARARLKDDIVHIALSDLDLAEPIGLSVPLDDPDRAADFAKLEREATWECDATLALNSLSNNASTLLGTELGNVSGKSLGSVFVPIPGPDGQMPILDALVQQAAFSAQWVRLAVDQSRQAIMNGVPFLSQTGHLGGYRGTLILPELPHTDLQVSRGEAMSEVAQRLDGALRGPIGRIITNADNINASEQGDLHDQYKSYASDIAAAGRHLLGLVDDLVDLQAIERSDFKVDCEQVDLADIARRASGLLAVRAADQSVRIDRPDEDETLFAMGEFRRVLQILVNLIGNAVRYSPKDSMVWIRTEQEGDLAVVIVADQGKGIAPQDQARIFEKFERIDTSEPGGSGLGLYIARKLARAMGGDITVDSAPGLGARFALSLPIAK